MGSGTRIKQVYEPYWLWECYLNGMYDSKIKFDMDSTLYKAIEFTGDFTVYGSAMIEVVDKWRVTMRHHLTNPNIGRRSFIGHCACSYKLNIPEFIVCIAWSKLTSEQRNLANNQADEAYKHWKKSYTRQDKRVCENMGKQMLLQWDT